MSSLGPRLTDAVSDAASSAFDVVARIRHSKPLHPRGIVVPARVDRTGTGATTGADWLDGTSALHGVARLSRSAGLPDGWPDVWGLALRVDLPGETPPVADLLLSAAGAGPVLRHVLALRRGPAAPFTSVLPYRTPSGGSVVLAALGPRIGLPSGRTALADALAREPVRLALVVSSPGGAWRSYGTLTLGGEPLGTGDGRPDADSRAAHTADISFDPVLNPLPGLVLPEPIATVRARAYAGARAGRRAPDETLRTSPADVVTGAAADREAVRLRR
jgi:hypothetical protein